MDSQQMDFERVAVLLKDRLKSPLPGQAAQAILAPEPRRQWPEGFDPSHARDAAGLVLVFPVNQRAHILLTLRAGTLGRHGGQVSLPGGVVEPGESFEQAALREAHEEVGLPIPEVRTLGLLTPIDIPVSGFRLHPVVATIAPRPNLRAANGEVADLLEVPLEALCDRSSLASRQRVWDGRSFRIPAFYIEGHEIWGATAMVLAEFLSLLGWRPAEGNSGGR
jgi:8-oxo-dGTP pyrophosphatase MutT (NUDIX family)